MRITQQNIRVSRLSPALASVSLCVSRSLSPQTRGGLACDSVLAGASTLSVGQGCRLLSRAGCVRDASRSPPTPSPCRRAAFNLRASHKLSAVLHPSMPREIGPEDVIIMHSDIWPPIKAVALIYILPAPGPLVPSFSRRA
ncbi:hypothetical protein OH76DRAFT_391161 [Lentinus brumalis]|uniref:Uncharacterized protein n=1 Tax=Lentinus brumalis TaxID=2498619 RepID=A0A371DVI5_9APHY|nr:hypothetical protein OH76DRAFT_391161 [Polyporus brumalis]